MYVYQQKNSDFAKRGWWSLILIKQTFMNACGRLYIRLGSMLGDTFYFPF